MSQTLTDSEKDDFKAVLRRDEPTVISLWGEGEHRTLSFYAKGTRLEARVALTEEEQDPTTGGAGPYHDVTLTDAEVRALLDGLSEAGHTGRTYTPEGQARVKLEALLPEPTTEGE